MLGNFNYIFVVCDFFKKNNCFKKSFRNTIRVSNRLDPDQAQRFVRPDLGPNCKGYRQMSKVAISKERVKAQSKFFFSETKSLNFKSDQADNSLEVSTYFL